MGIFTNLNNFLNGLEPDESPKSKEANNSKPTSYNEERYYSIDASSREKVEEYKEAAKRGEVDDGVGGFEKHALGLCFRGDDGVALVDQEDEVEQDGKHTEAFHHAESRTEEFVHVFEFDHFEDSFDGFTQKKSSSNGGHKGDEKGREHGSFTCEVQRLGDPGGKMNCRPTTCNNACEGGKFEY